MDDNRPPDDIVFHTTPRVYDGVAPQHQTRFRAMQESPSLSYIVTCAFLFYVFMCATLLDSLVGYNLRNYIQSSEKIKHALGLVVLIFTIGIVTKVSNLWVIVGAGLAVYLWFLTMTKMPAQWNIVLLILLMICFILNSIAERIYTPNWVFSASTEEKVNRREETRESCIRGIQVIGCITLSLSVLMVMWFFSSWRNEQVRKYGRDSQQKWWWKLVFQPDSESVAFHNLWKGQDARFHTQLTDQDIAYIRRKLSQPTQKAYI